MRRRNFLRLGSDEAIDGALAACGADSVTLPPAGTVRGWNGLALRAIHDTQPDAHTATRALAALHTCMYNAWAAYDEVARQTMHGRAVRLPRAERSAASKASAMSHAAYFTLCERFPSQQAGFDAWMADLGLDPSCPDGQFTPAGIGRSQASAMLDFCRRDSADAPDQPAAAEQSFALATQHHIEDRRAAPGTDAALLPRWCRLAHALSERDGYDEDRDVLLYFVLTNALANAGDAAADAGTAAAVVLRSFSGRNQAGAGHVLDVAGQELGRKVGAQVFDRARRHWQGKL